MDISTVQTIISSSNTISTWSLSMLAASILAIVSTSYVRPGKWGKLLYLLFIPGWIFLILAIDNNNTIVRRGIAATIDENRILSIIEKMNDEFALQLSNFKASLIFFGIWLLLFLLWWIFQDFFNKPKNVLAP